MVLATLHQSLCHLDLRDFKLGAPLHCAQACCLHSLRAPLYSAETNQQSTILQLTHVQGVHMHMPYAVTALAIGTTPSRHACLSLSKSRLQFHAYQYCPPGPSRLYNVNAIQWCVPLPGVMQSHTGAASQDVATRTSSRTIANSPANSPPHTNGAKRTAMCSLL